jgi:FkbM family methyltransferase
MKYLMACLFITSSISASYKSQAGQDRFVNEQLFHNRKGGFFLDIGAHDGQSFSNTWFFEKDLGWKGICFEPIPHLFEQLNACRDCICINACVSGINGDLPFLHVDGCDEMLSGLCGTFNQNKLTAVLNDIAAFGGDLEVIQVPSVRLDDILAEYGITHVDFLSLDVEGHELEVLKTIDFSQVTIDVITVENDYNDEAIRDILISNGFILFGRVHVDDIFVRKDLIS